MTQRITYLGGKIDPVIARERCVRFREIKKDDVRIAINKEPDETIQYDVKAFSEMLQQVLKYKSVTGVNIYFACYDPAHGEDRIHIPDNKEQMLTLVFVPTVEMNGSVMYDNLTKDYYIMKKNGKGHVNLNKPPKNTDLVSRWIDKYQQDVLVNLLNGDDTKSVWYQKDVIVEIVNAINNGIENNTIDSMLYSFAAHSGGDKIDTTLLNGQRIKLEIDYHLSGIFWFGLNLDPDNFRELISSRNAFENALAYKDEASGNKRSQRKLLAEGDSYDTGIPIPPAGGDGSLLP